MTKALSGIFAPVTTPFVDEEVSFDRLKENMKKYASSSLSGIFALGSNGESKSLTEEEKIKILRVILEEKGENQLVMAGTGYESTRETIRFSKKVAEAGADFVSVVTPSYFKKCLTDDAMVRYYTDIADAVPIPVLVYNAPGFTGMTLTPKVVGKLAGHPNIAGMKDSSTGNMNNYIIAAGGAPFCVLAGTISTLFSALPIGATGGVVSLADAFPEPPCALYQKYVSGDMDGARELHFKLYALNSAVSGNFGVAGVKYAMELGGFHGGAPRLPLLPLQEEDKQSIRGAVEKAGLL
ncbi:MAG TPA: dihydrodipicolinate synthase family protein [Deltaproteobacteria bacterium]|nr:dihydrodipicolinate synthase family protein [Deltaproteobacteria bacterium]